MMESMHLNSVNDEEININDFIYDLLFMIVSWYWTNF